MREGVGTERGAAAAADGWQGCGSDWSSDAWNDFLISLGKTIMEKISANDA